MTSNAVIYFLILALVSITGHAAARATSSSPAITLRKRRTNASNVGKSAGKADKPVGLHAADEKRSIQSERLSVVRNVEVSGSSVTSQEILDEKEELRELIARGLVPAQPVAHAIRPEQVSLDSLPLFRSRTGEVVGLHSGAEGYGYASQSSGESLEDMEKVELRRRRRQELRKSLKVIIPNGQYYGQVSVVLHLMS